MRFSLCNIFVSQKTLTIAKPKKRFSLLPCGIDISESQLTEKTVARQRMGMSLTKKYILFAGAFDNKVKNAPLAIEATSLIHEDNVELLELKGYKRDEVTLLMCAADVFLMTSFSEGSPQVIKEALACGCPIVSVDVGDVMERVAGVEGCVVVASDSQSIADAIRCAFTFEGKTKGRDAILRDGLTNFQVASEILRVYNSII